MISLDDAQIRVQNNGALIISTGKSRYETSWHNTSMQWSVLLKRLSESNRTGETHAEYMRMGKEQQEHIKDIGGFVGGHLKGGVRRNGSVEARQILTLDLDYPPKDLWDQLINNLDLDCAFAVYSTHKHTTDKPRLRLVMPLNRPVSPDEYEAIARKTAEKIGIDYFDDSTFQPARLMFWPSHSADVEPFFQYVDSAFLQADDVLAEYTDWTDTSYWPVSSRMNAVRKKLADKQGNPLEKKGLIGAFCRTYTVPEAIATFLPEVYLETAKENRYTYAGGSSAAGLVLYEDGLFAFSNHATDPASGQLCNAFDLVRLHKFGGLDDEAPPGTAVSKLPSYKAMCEFASADAGVKKQIAADAAEDFGETGGDWLAEMHVSNKGVYAPDAWNCLLILRNDPQLQGIAYNGLSGGVEAASELPWDRENRFWSDADDAQLFMYVSNRWGVNFPDRIFQRALVSVTQERRFNPLKDYITNLPEWDGIERVDRLLVDYLGAQDTPYTRAVTRKSLVGCIMRVLDPGCKFDTVLVLDGKPGIGKSTLLRRLGGDWFSDNLSLADTRDKTAAEKIRGCWIMEIGEMQGTRKADIDVLKGFLSRQVDEYRPAYGRVLERHPRTCVIFGTTNTTTGFLRDTTGNRRFWPVPVEGGGRSAWDMSEDERAQIWAEAKARWAAGEKPYLSKELEEEAARMQQEALEYDDREGSVIEYLDTLLPDGFYSWDTFKRVDYFQQHDELSADDGTAQRMHVCALEIFCECFGRPRNTWKKQDGYEIAAIMARLPNWERTGITARIPGYGKQRVYTRKVVTK